jgi:hypothetical protein
MTFIPSFNDGSSCTTTCDSRRIEIHDSEDPSINGRARLMSSTKCELEPLYLPAHLVEEAQMGRLHIRRYENGLVRKKLVERLRVGKPKLSEV